MEVMIKIKMMMIMMGEEEEEEEVAEAPIAKLNQTLCLHLNNLLQVNKMKTAMGVCIQNLNQSKEMMKMMRGFHGINLKNKLLEVGIFLFCSNISLHIFNIR